MSTSVTVLSKPEMKMLSMPCGVFVVILFSFSTSFLLFVSPRDNYLCDFICLVVSRDFCQ